MTVLSVQFTLEIYNTLFMAKARQRDQIK